VIEIKLPLIQKKKKKKKKKKSFLINVPKGEKINVGIN
jgi:hypothetical protein